MYSTYRPSPRPVPPDPTTAPNGQPAAPKPSEMDRLYDIMADWTLVPPTSDEASVAAQQGDGPGFNAVPYTGLPRIIKGRKFIVVIPDTSDLIEIGCGLAAGLRKRGAIVRRWKLADLGSKYATLREWCEAYPAGFIYALTTDRPWEHDVGFKEPEASERVENGDDGDTSRNQKPWKSRPLGIPDVKAGPFPIEVFPEPIQRLMVELAATMTVPIDYVGVSVLVVAASAIGQSVNIRLKSTWTEAPQFYVALVGPKGVKKSPPLKWLIRPLAEIDCEHQEVYQRLLETWEKEDPKIRSSKPTCKRLLVQDITTESLTVIHAENPRGLLAYRDELTAWVRSFNQYKGKGGDRQYFLSNASGAPIQCDRKGGRERLTISHPLINVCGGLVPSNLATLAQDDLDGRAKSEQSDDGFLDRLVFGFPDVFPPQVWTELEISSESENLWFRSHQAPDEQTHDADREFSAPLVRGIRETSSGPVPLVARCTHERGRARV